MKRFIFSFASLIALVSLIVPTLAWGMNEGQDGGQCEAGYMAAYADHFEYCLEGNLYWIWRFVNALFNGLGVL